MLHVRRFITTNDTNDVQQDAEIHGSAKNHGIAVYKFIFKWRHRPLMAWECLEQYQL
jgi:hypothetical protein